MSSTTVITFFLVVPGVLAVQQHERRVRGVTGLSVEDTKPFDVSDPVAHHLDPLVY
jgi:hypothetical protein